MENEINPVFNNGMGMDEIEEQGSIVRMFYLT